MYEYCIMRNLCIDTCVAYSVPGKISLILAIKHDVTVSDVPIFCTSDTTITR